MKTGTESAHEVFGSNQAASFHQSLQTCCVTLENLAMRFIDNSSLTHDINAENIIGKQAARKKPKID